MRSELDEKKIDMVVDRPGFTSMNKRPYTTPTLTVLSAELSINGGNSAYQVENTNGVFNTHS